MAEDGFPPLYAYTVVSAHSCWTSGPVSVVLHLSLLLRLKPTVKPGQGWSLPLTKWSLNCWQEKFTTLSVFFCKGGAAWQADRHKCRKKASSPFAETPRRKPLFELDEGNIVVITSWFESFVNHYLLCRAYLFVRIVEGVCCGGEIQEQGNSSHFVLKVRVN